MLANFLLCTQALLAFMLSGMLDSPYTPASRTEARLWLVWAGLCGMLLAARLAYQAHVTTHTDEEQ